MKATFGIFAAVVAIITPSAWAHKDAAKGGLDDCYLELMEIGDAVSAANIHAGGVYADGSSDGEAVAVNTKFVSKKARCNALQLDYEKKYGKYTLPQRPRPSVRDSRENVGTLKDLICSTRDWVHRAQQPFTPTGADVRENEKAAWEQRRLEVPGQKKELDGYLARYKTATGKGFNIDRYCSPVLSNEEAKVMNNLNMDGITMESPHERFEEVICSERKALTSDASGESHPANDIRKEKAALLTIYQKKTGHSFDETSCDRVELDALVREACDRKLSLPEVERQNPFQVPAYKKEIEELSAKYKGRSSGKELDLSKCKRQD